MLEVCDLCTQFTTPRGNVRAVDGVSFSVSPGRVLALVGESGCGKSVTALSILRLLPPVARIAGGEVLFDGADLLKLDADQMRRIRGRRIGVVFQEPMAALNPVMTIGRQVSEVIEQYSQLRGAALAERTLSVLARVALPDPPRNAKQYPHQLSGGMRQRAMIAIAIAADPELIIADEPTTALDLAIQAQILDLLRSLIKPMPAATAEYGQSHPESTMPRARSLMIITHDFGVVAAIADDVVVMYAGRVVESGPTGDVLSRPRHPYTRALLACVPSLRRSADRLPVIPGTVPAAGELPSGCRFHPRCELGAEDEKCRASEPALEMVGDGHLCACWKSDRTL